ncbi:MAG: hypothetical protein HKO59_14960 [Phycisphaerales bacterium]|nr:site-2 protease family protein [Phycisphaerae bacterium]NNF44641.1 hypothetical protein [Phycisphaerales bacterium]NNM27259.1 hypothetical protein [Phycisphaerales bacterium]
MTWRDRGDTDDPRHRIGRPGGDWQGVRPTLDNPMSWSIGLGRVAGIDVRVHAVFLLYLVIQLARAWRSPHIEDAAPLSVGLVAMEMGCLFGIVLLHEFGHCIACRRVGGEADEILMWPLGGLAFCRPESRWRAHLITAAGGPAVNVVIILILGPILGGLTGRWAGVAVPNPLVLDIGGVVLADGRQPWWLLAMFFVHFISLVLLLFNLLPIFPLDGGRICQALLWPRYGYERSMRLAVYAGYFGAVGLFILGAVVSDWMLIGIALFGGITCYVTLKQLEWTDAFMQEGETLYAASQWGPGDEEPASPSRRDEERRERAIAREEDEAEHVDRILAKIGEQGMQSLSLRERRVLKRATDRRRRESDDD